MHLTDFLPENGSLVPRYEVFKNGDGAIAGKYRTTIHGSLSYPVTSHGMGYWADKRYIVLIPFENISRNVVGYNLDDVYVVGKIELGKGSIVKEVKNENLSEATNAMLASGIIDRVTMEQIITDIMSNKHDYKFVVTNAIRNDWNVDLEYVRTNLRTDHPLKPIIDAIPNLTVSRYIESPLQYVTIQEILKMGRLPLSRGIKPTASPAEIFEHKMRESQVENPWEWSGLDRFLKQYYGSIISKNYLSDLLVRQSHSNSVWKDVEDIYDFANGARDGMFAITNITSKIVSVPLGKERIMLALQMVKLGGKLWVEVVKNSWRTPKSLLYGLDTLNSIRHDLERDLKKNKSSTNTFLSGEKSPLSQTLENLPCALGYDQTQQKTTLADGSLYWVKEMLSPSPDKYLDTITKNDNLSSKIMRRAGDLHSSPALTGPSRLSGDAPSSGVYPPHTISITNIFDWFVPSVSAAGPKAPCGTFNISNPKLLDLGTLEKRDDGLYFGNTKITPEGILVTAATGDPVKLYTSGPDSIRVDNQPNRNWLKFNWPPKLSANKLALAQSLLNQELSRWEPTSGTSLRTPIDTTAPEGEIRLLTPQDFNYAYQWQIAEEVIANLQLPLWLEDAARKELRTINEIEYPIYIPKVNGMIRSPAELTDQTNNQVMGLISTDFGRDYAPNGELNSVANSIMEDQTFVPYFENRARMHYKKELADLTPQEKYYLAARYAAIQVHQAEIITDSLFDDSGTDPVRGNYYAFVASSDTVIDHEMSGLYKKTESIFRVLGMEYEPFVPRNSTTIGNATTQLSSPGYTLGFVLPGHPEIRQNNTSGSTASRSQIFQTRWHEATHIDQFRTYPLAYTRYNNTTNGNDYTFVEAMTEWYSWLVPQLLKPQANFVEFSVNRGYGLGALEFHNLVTDLYQKIGIDAFRSAFKSAQTADNIGGVRELYDKTFGSGQFDTRMHKYSDYNITRPMVTGELPKTIRRLPTELEIFSQPTNYSYQITTPDNPSPTTHIGVIDQDIIKQTLDLPIGSEITILSENNTVVGKYIKNVMGQWVKLDHQDGTGGGFTDSVIPLPSPKTDKIKLENLTRLFPGSRVNYREVPWQGWEKELDMLTQSLEPNELLSAKRHLGNILRFINPKNLAQTGLDLTPSLAAHLSVTDLWGIVRGSGTAARGGRSLEASLKLIFAIMPFTPTTTTHQFTDKWMAFRMAIIAKETLSTAFPKDWQTVVVQPKGKPILLFTYPTSGLNSQLGQIIDLLLQEDTIVTVTLNNNSVTVYRVQNGKLRVSPQTYLTNPDNTDFLLAQYEAYLKAQGRADVTQAAQALRQDLKTRGNTLDVWQKHIPNLDSFIANAQGGVPIKPGEEFDALKELDKISMSTAPLSERKQMLSVYKQKLIYKLGGFGELYQELVLAASTMETKGEFLAIIGKYKDFGFTKEELDRFDEVIDTFIKNRQQINIIHLSSLTEKDLVKKLFGFEPEGKIEVEYRPLGIAIKVYSQKDWAIMDQFEGERISTIVDESNITVARNTKGISFGKVLVPEISNLVIGLNYSHNYSEAELLDTLTHEERHKINVILLGRTNAFVSGHEFTDELIHSNDSNLEDIVVKSLSSQLLTLANSKASDEIFAKLASGIDRASIKQDLFLGLSYKFRLTAHQKLANTVIGRIGVLVSPELRIKAIEISNKWMADNLLSFDAFLAQAKINDEGIDAFDLLLKKGYSREQAIGILYNSELPQWPRVASRMPDINPTQSPISILGIANMVENAADELRERNLGCEGGTACQILDTTSLPRPIEGTQAILVSVQPNNVFQLDTVDISDQGKPAVTVAEGKSIQVTATDGSRAQVTVVSINSEGTQSKIKVEPQIEKPLSPLKQN
ncbi:MAG: hypothetical protein AAB768_01935 [Patescibacteria group bacterium]